MKVVSVLVEEEERIRRFWSEFFEERKISLEVFASESEFLSYFEPKGRLVRFYFDQDIEGRRGVGVRLAQTVQNWPERISTALVTAYPPEYFRKELSVGILDAVYEKYPEDIFGEGFYDKRMFQEFREKGSDAIVNESLEKLGSILDRLDILAIERHSDDVPKDEAPAEVVTPIPLPFVQRQAKSSMTVWWPALFLRRVFFLTLSMVALFSGCSSRDRDVRKASTVPATTTRYSDDSESRDYVHWTKKSEFGDLELYSITPEAFNKQRSKFSVAGLRLVDLSSTHNVEVFVPSLSGYSGAVIVKPRIFLRSLFSGGRPRHMETSDGNIVVDVSIALVDGLSGSLSTGRGVQTIPEEFLIKDRKTFYSDLETRIGAPPVVVSSLRCPENMTLQVDGFGALPIEFQSRLTSCPTNTLLPAQVTIKKDDWEGVQIAFASSKRVAVQAKLNISMPITLDYGKITLKREVVSENISRALKDKTDPISLGSAFELGRLLVGQVQKSFSYSAPLEQGFPLQDEIIRDFFYTRFDDGCPKGWGVCLFQKNLPDIMTTGQYILGVKRVEYVGTPRVIELSSPVYDYLLDQQKFTARSESGNIFEPPNAAEVNQLFRTVYENDFVELRITKLELSEIGLREPKFERISNKICIEPHSLCVDGRWRCTNPDSQDENCRNVCTGGYSRECKRSMRVCKDEHYPAPCMGSFCLPSVCGNECREWENVCHGWAQVCDKRRVCDRLTPPKLPALPFRTDKVSPAAQDFAWECAKYEQNRCDPDKWEDQWQRVTTWSPPISTGTLQSVNWSSKYWNAVIHGISFRFSSSTKNGPKELNCSLSDMHYVVFNDDTLLVTFQNTEKCSPFTKESREFGFAPSLSLLNNIKLPSEFQCGSLTESWQGKRRYICRTPDGTESALETSATEDEARVKKGERTGIYRTYYPRVTLHGSLKVVGSYLESYGTRL